MPLSDTFMVREVDDAVSELKNCIDDAKKNGIFQHLVERYLPRLSHILTHNKVLIEMLNELPKSDTQSVFDCMANRDFEGTSFSVEPKTRLSQQVQILVLGGEGRLDLCDFTDIFFGRNGASKFWEELFFPATRDLMRHAMSLQGDFDERKGLNDATQKLKMNTPKSYALDLFISHSSKDKRLAKNLIEFLRAALAIPADRVRCTSVDGYKLFGGAKTETELKKEIRGAQCFIGLMTPDRLQSQFVLFELGARWGLDEHLVPILGGGIAADVLHPPLSNLNALNSVSKPEMEQLVHDLAKELKKPVPLPATYEAQLSALLKTHVIRKVRHTSAPVRSAQPTQPTQPDWHNFDSDHIFGVLWRWNYSGNTLRESSLSAFCPQQGCMNRLEIEYDPQNPNFARSATIDSGVPETMSCQRCGFKRHFDCDRETLKQKVIYEIERLIHTGQYVQRMIGASERK
jgi:hypothetical protein